MLQSSSLRSVALLGALLACACSSRETVVHHQPLAAGELPARGPSLVEHAPGQCRLCDLYHEMRERVVLLRAGGSLGAGVVVDSTGLIVTNAHVVEDRERVEVETAGGVAWRGIVLRRDPEVDLALVRVDGTGLAWSAAAFDEYEAPQVGSEAYVLGHPLGFGWTITRGIVSGVRRPGEFGPVAMIQTDAAISPGNSGGPLLDRDGRVIGIVTAKIVSRGSESLAFAIPAPAVRRFLGESVPAPR